MTEIHFMLIPVNYRSFLNELKKLNGCYPAWELFFYFRLFYVVEINHLNSTHHKLFNSLSEC